MLTLILRSLKDRWKSLVVFIGSGVAFLWMYVAMFPSLQGQSEDFDKLLDSFPTELLEGLGVSEINFNSISNFVGYEHFSIIWPLLAIFLMAGFAANSFAKEIETGTAEILLSRPISRLKIFGTRYLTGIIILAIFSILSILAIIPLAELHNVEYSTKPFLVMTLLGFLFGWAVYGIAVLFSVMFSEKSKVSMFTGGLLIIMYAFRILASFIEGIEGIKWVSLFHYFNFNAALSESTIATESILVFVGVTLATTIIAAWRFNTRDIAV